MTILYAIGRPQAMGDVVRFALNSWRRDAVITVVNLSEPDRLSRLLLLATDETQDFRGSCFAIDGSDPKAWADFNVFLSVLRDRETTTGARPALIRSLNCPITR